MVKVTTKKTSDGILIKATEGKFDFSMIQDELCKWKAEERIKEGYRVLIGGIPEIVWES